MNFARWETIENMKKLLYVLILVLAVGVTYGLDGGLAIGPIRLSGLAIAAIVGVILNAVFPKDK